MDVNSASVNVLHPAVLLTGISLLKQCFFGGYDGLQRGTSRKSDIEWFADYTRNIKKIN